MMCASSAFDGGATGDAGGGGASACSAAAQSLPALTEVYPYSRPKQDPQKLMRASLASSCLRGQVRVWQFQGGEGVRGRQLRRDGCKLRPRLIRAGVLRGAVAAVARACDADSPDNDISVGNEEMWLRPFAAEDFAALQEAIGLRHWSMAEWIMRDGAMPGFHFGLLSSKQASADPIHLSARSSTALHSHLVPIAHAACKAGWDGGLQRVEVLMRDSDDPLVQESHAAGEFSPSLSVACARSGGSVSLRWTEHFASQEGVLMHGGTSRLAARAGQVIVQGCTLPVAKWLAAQGILAVRDVFEADALVRAAASSGNWSVMEWVVRSLAPAELRAFCARNTTPTHTPIDCAAAHNNVRVLAFLDRHGLGGCTTSAALRAARAGHVRVLEWLRTRINEGIPGEAVTCAVEGGQLAAVEYLVDKCNLEWSRSDVVAAAAHGQLRVLEWARDKGYLLRPAGPNTSWTMYRADPSFVVSFMLKHAARDAVRWDLGTMWRACGHPEGLPIVEALHHRMPGLLKPDWHAKAAAESGSLRTLGYILRDATSRSARLTRPQDVLFTACQSDRVDVVEYVLESFPALLADEATLARVWEDAVNSNALSVISWLMCHGYSSQQGPPAAELGRSAARAGHLKLLRFLAEHCHLPLPPPTVADIQELVRARHLHILEYLLAPSSSSAASWQAKVPALLAMASATGEGPPHWPTVRFLRHTGLSLS